MWHLRSIGNCGTPAHVRIYSERRRWGRHDRAWFRAAQRSHAGHIRAGGIDKDVTIAEEADPAINDRIDAAYRAKYGRYPQYVAPMLTAEVKSTTIKLPPRSANE